MKKYMAPQVDVKRLPVYEILTASFEDTDGNGDVDVDGDDLNWWEKG